MLDRNEMRTQALRALEPLDFTPDPDIRVDRLSFAERQLVAIAKALRKRCRLLILDEPTAALETREIERLFVVLARMKYQGTAIIYVSHRLDEVVTLADRCTVLRDGRVVATSRRGAFSVNDLVQAMTGRAEADIGTVALIPGDARLEETGPRVDAVRLRAKEIVGLAGLVGSGRSELAQAVFGVFPPESGTVEFDGRAVKISRPEDAIALGIAYAPEDRQRQGLVIAMTVAENIGLTRIWQLMRGPFLDSQAEDRLAQEYIGTLRIKTPDSHQVTRNLSGGNQQKIDG